MSAGGVFREPSVSYTWWTIRCASRFRIFSRWWRDCSSPVMRSCSPFSINIPKWCLQLSLIIFAFSFSVRLLELFEVPCLAVHCTSRYSRNSPFLYGRGGGRTLHGPTVAVSFSSRIGTATLHCLGNISCVLHFPCTPSLFVKGWVTQDRYIHSAIPFPMRGAWYCTSMV